MATATTPAGLIPKRPSFNRETKSLIDSLGGGIQSITPRSSRSARNSNQVSPVPSPGPTRPRFRLPSASRRLTRRDNDDRPLPPSSSNEQLVNNGSSSSLNNTPSITSPLATNQPSSASSSSFPILESTSHLTNDEPSGSVPPKRKRNGTKSSSTRRPGSDSSLSDLSDSEHPAKRPPHPHINPALSNASLGSSTSSPAVPQTTSPASCALSASLLRLPSDQSLPKTQRLILKPPMPKPLCSDVAAKTPSSSSLSIPRIILPPEREPSPSYMKGKRKVPLLKGAAKRSAMAKAASLRSRSSSHTPRSRRLTELQKQEIEQKRAKLLANLDEEEAMIRSSNHPLLIELQANIERGRLVKLRQAHLKHEALKAYFDRQHHEAEQRVWSTWADEKTRLRSELLLKCQLQLARAPFEFVMSNDTTNLQAMFHLTPLPKLAPFVPDVAHTISADSLALGLERQRIKNHATWFLPATTIEADLALLRGTSTSQSIKFEDHTQGSAFASNNLLDVGIPPNAIKQRTKKSSHELASSSGARDHLSRVPTADEAKHNFEHPSPFTKELPPNSSAHVPYLSATTAHMPECTSHSQPSTRKVGRPRNSTKSTQSSAQIHNEELSRPRRRSSRQQNKQLHDAQVSPDLDDHKFNEDDSIRAPQLESRSSSDDIRGAIHTWAFPETSRNLSAISPHLSAAVQSCEHHRYPRQATPVAHYRSENVHNIVISPHPHPHPQHHAASSQSCETPNRPSGSGGYSHSSLHPLRDQSQRLSDKSHHAPSHLYSPAIQYESKIQSTFIGSSAHLAPERPGSNGVTGTRTPLARTSSAPHRLTTPLLYDSPTSSPMQTETLMGKSMSTDRELPPYRVQSQHMFPIENPSHPSLKKVTTGTGVGDESGSGGMKTKDRMMNYQPRTSSSLKMTNFVE